MFFSHSGETGTAIAFDAHRSGSDRKEATLTESGTNRVPEKPLTGFRDDSALPLSVTAALLVVFSGCAPMPQRIAQTASGRPEVVISTIDVNLVKSELVNVMQSGGFLLQDESDYRMVFTRELDGSQATLARLAIGNAYSTTPQAEVAFTFAKMASSVRVVAFASITTQMPYGQIQRGDMKDNNAWFNDFYSALQNVKVRVECR